MMLTKNQIRIGIALFLAGGVYSAIFIGIKETYTFSTYFTQLVVIFMWMRSGFYVMRIWHTLTYYEKMVYMTPIFLLGALALYNLHDLNYMMLRYPVKSIGSIAAAWAIYEMSKKMKNNLWTIRNTIKEEWNNLEKENFKKIKGNNNSVNNIQILTKKDIEDSFKMFKVYDDSKTQLKRVMAPSMWKTVFKFVGDMLFDGEWTWHIHPDLKEVAVVDSGEVMETYSGEIYKAGDIITIEPNQPHGYKALQRSEISFYLFDA